MKNNFGSKTQKEAEELLKTVKMAGEIKRAQCVLFHCLGSDSRTIGRLVGYGSSHVRLVWQWYRAGGWSRLLGERRGQNRGKAHMSLKEEVSFLEQFKSKAEKGRILISRDIHKSHAEKIGKSIDKTITYRLLCRHGWRKIAPRPEHPKHNIENMHRFREAIFPPGYDPYAG